MERGVIMFVANVKSKDSASVLVCYDRREMKRGVIKFDTNVKSKDSASVL